LNIAILNLQEIEELDYTLDCLQFIDAEIIGAQIDIFAGYDFNEQINNTYIKNIFPLHLRDLSLNDLSIKYSQIRSYARLGKYNIAVDTECSFKSALVTYFLSGRTAGFKKSGFLGYLISKFYDETIPYDVTKDKRELTFILLAKTFGFDNKLYAEKLI
jgi:ADP-heptose:LPS heptosyltransferase